MTRRYLRSAIIFSALLACFTCDQEFDTLSEEQFTLLSNLNPITCITTKQGRQPVGYCLACENDVVDTDLRVLSPTISLYQVQMFANRWQITKKDTVINAPFSYYQFDSPPEHVKIAGKEYLYLETHHSSMGSAMGSYTDIDFTLIPLPYNNERLTLKYFGEHKYFENEEFVNGEFNIAALPKGAELSFLEKRATNHHLIRPTSTHVNLQSPDNYEELWHSLNPDFITPHSLADGVYNGKLALNWYSPEFENIISDYIFSETSLRKYRIVTLFRNSVFIYDKSERLWAPLIVESCSHCCNKELTIMDNGYLLIRYSECNPHYYTIDLESMRYTLTVRNS